MASKKIKSHSKERWVKVPTKAKTRYNDYYFSDFGRIKSVSKLSGKEKLLKGARDIYGNPKISISVVGSNTRQVVYLHLLVGNEFLKPPTPEHKFIIRKDNNKENNHYKNLKWMTQEEVIKHHRKIWLNSLKNTQRSSRTKLTIAQVKQLKRKLKKGRTKPTVLAKEFGISVSQVRRIANSDNWGDIKI